MAASPEPVPVDLVLIIAEREWDQEQLRDSKAAFYRFLAEDIPHPVDVTICETGTVQRFVLKHTKLVTIAARVPIGPVDTAVVTRFLLEKFQPAIVAQVGFGGILSDDLKLGDVAIASQVDCYLVKDRAGKPKKDKAGKPKEGSASDATRITFAGEVYRPSLSLLQLAINLKHLHPEIHAEFQNEARQSLSLAELLQDPANEIRKYLRAAESNATSEASQVHSVHFACAEMVSTTENTVSWLKARDRKFAIIDMESGGLLAAAWEYTHRHNRRLETLIIRGAGGYGDEKHDTIIKNNAEAIRRCAFENACLYLCRVLSVRDKPTIQNSDAKTLPAIRSRSVDVGILIPLEEEFSYFAGLLESLLIEFTAEYVEGRFYYFFNHNGVTCAATFVGEMGLVRMALATEDLFRALSPNLLVILGIAAGFGDNKIGDVVVAKRVDLYFYRARGVMKDADSANGNLGKIAELRNEPPIETSQDLVEFVTEDPRFSSTRTAWGETCENELKKTLNAEPSNAAFILEDFMIAQRPEVTPVRLATGELLAASREFGQLLVDRGCSATDMEAGGAAVAYQRIRGERGVQHPPKLLVLRGISDRGDEQKNRVEQLKPPNAFRRACMRNASRLLILLLGDPNFVRLFNQKSQ